MAKKKDNARGFQQLIGKTIASVNAECINLIILTDSDGIEYTIEVNDFHVGIPVISLETLKG
jgi:hypothetical protein